MRSFLKILPIAPRLRCLLAVTINSFDELQSVIYFIVQLDQQEMSNLVSQIPEENLLLIKPSHESDEHYGVIEENWYGYMIKNLPRQILDSLEIIHFSDFKKFMELSERNAGQRQFAGNIALASV